MPTTTRRRIVRDVRIDEVSFCPEGKQKQARVVLMKAMGNPMTRDRVMQQIEGVAEGIRKAAPTLTREQAIAKAIAERPDLYRAYEDARAPVPSLAALAKAKRDAAQATIAKAAEQRREREPALSAPQAVAAVIHERPELYAAAAGYAT